MKKKYVWSDSKNQTLIAERGISFQEIQNLIAAGNILGIRRNRSRNHPHQQVYVVVLNDYPWVVPFEETEDTILLKTAYPSRALKRELEIQAQVDERGAANRKGPR